MYLSKLEILGFKSFAQRVGLTFDSGISAIVGPNGCGKTNIVDAIRWVLGEQRYSALRSEKMEDVIFNGTKGRKALGMAEVSLVIENTKGILPSEYSQVTVGRRVFRSGESEYLLNRVPCRLKDILDLFMDTGMGADAYSVIELKMIETILSDKTDERRHLFEEAAGVTKYKHRRKSAYRKLEAVQADLVRVNDIVAEVQKAVSTLERQARRAGQFNEVKARLRSTEIDLMERELAQYIERSVPLQAKAETLRTEKSSLDADLAREEDSLETLRSEMILAERTLGEWQLSLSEVREQIHQVEQRRLVATERQRSLQQNIERLEAEITEFAARRERIAATREEFVVRLEGLRRREEELRLLLDARKAELADVEALVESRRADLHALNDELIALVHDIAERQSDLDRRRGRVENLTGRIERGDEESSAYGQDITRLDNDIAELTARDQTLRREKSEAEIRLFEAEETRTRIADAIEEARRKELERRSDIERRRARVDFLTGLLESREGMPDGVRYLATTDRWKPARHMTVADALHADERLRAALEAALGEYAGWLLVDTGSDADEGITLLTTDRRGKATFVCLDRMPIIESVRRVPAGPGILGWASDLAHYDPIFEPVFRLLFDGVLVVESREAAAGLNTRLSGVRCVTLDGEILTGIGITRGGSRREDEGGSIGRQRQIAELQAEIAELDEGLRVMEADRDRLSQELALVDLKTLSDAVKAVDKEMSAVEVRIAQVAFEKKRAGDVIAKNAEERETLSGELTALNAEIERDIPALDTLKDRKADVERSIGALTHDIDERERERADRSAVVQQLGIDYATLQGEMQTAASDRARAERTATDLEAAIDKHRRAIDRSREDVAATEGTTGDTLRDLETLRADLQAMEVRRGEYEQNAVRIRNDIHRIELRIKDLHRSVEENMRTLYDCDLKVADLAAKADHIRARSQEEFEHELELKAYPPDEFVDFAALRDEIQALRDKVKSLGNINFAAFEEYTTEKQRLDFMTAQRNDLLEAEKTLLQTIEEINQTAQRKFLETFDKIRQNFIDTFKSLFDPGDECDLKLEEGVDPLEARIEIVAKPRGKRPTSIDLLSGGEKTLTAIALLFAIYLVKPSPFCILDEVDAPLDDANIDRYTRILRKFSKDTQFIVVTHNKRTMEAANALYGVTMEEEGVSKIVTVRFNQGAQVAAAAVASA